MKLFPVKICKQLLKDKYNITKGISKYNKQQLNNLLYNLNTMITWNAKRKHIILLQIWFIC